MTAKTIRGLFIFVMIIIPVFVFSGEDNYLFDNKEICTSCLAEINGGKNPVESECYTCKGRYGDKPGNKYFIVMNAENIVNKESDSETNNARTSRHYSSKEEIRIRKQQGMNEDAVKKLCPGTYNKYKKKNGDTGP